MLFHSTRGKDSNKTFEEVLMQGLAQDGGLFVPDYWPEVNYEHFDNTEIYMKNLPKSQSHLFTTKATHTYTDCQYQEHDYLVFGSETTGLSEKYLEHFSESCRTIPMKNPAIRSLNLSNAVSIVTYEALRQLNLRVT